MPLGGCLVGSFALARFSLLLEPGSSEREIPMRYSNNLLADMAKVLGVSCALAFSACGSDNDSTSTSSSYSSISSSSSSSVPNDENVPPVVDAGENVRVAAGEQVYLTGTASDSDGYIASHTWVQTSGPRVPLIEVDAEAGHVTFRAPNTGPSEEVTLVFRFTVTDDANAQSSDTLEVTVTRVNQPPVVQTDGLVVADNPAQVPLRAFAYDTDGSVETYVWQQVSGESATIVNGNTADAHVVLPAAGEEDRFTFAVEVTDNDGLTATDTLTVVMGVMDAPEVQMDFPPPRGAYHGDNLDVYGRVSNAEGVDIERINVNAGGETVVAEVDSQGRWRASQVPVSGATQVRITVQALDSEGRTGYAESQLLRTDRFVFGPAVPWGQTTAMLMAPDGNTVWLLAESQVDEEYMLMAVDVRRGFRQTIVTDFGDPSLGPVANEYASITYDEGRDTFYLAALPETVEDVGYVYRLDGQTGMREPLPIQFDDPESLLIAPQDMFLHTDGELYVADVFGQIVTVDPQTGEAQVLADYTVANEPISMPTALAWDEGAERLLVLQEQSSSVDLLGLYLEDPVRTEMISAGADISFGPEPNETGEGLAVDQQNQRAFVLAGGSNTLIEIDLLTGERAILLEEFGPQESTANALVYDAERRVLYGVAGQDYDQALYMIDPHSGSRVTVSTSF